MRTPLRAWVSDRRRDGGETDELWPSGVTGAAGPSARLRRRQRGSACVTEKKRQRTRACPLTTEEDSTQTPVGSSPPFMVFVCVAVRLGISNMSPAMHKNASQVIANCPWLSVYHIQAPAVLQICHRAASKSHVHLCNLSHGEQQLKEGETMSAGVANGIVFHFLTSFEPDKEMRSF